MIISEKLIKCVKSIKNLAKKVILLYNFNKQAPKSILESKINEVNAIETDTDNMLPKPIALCHHIFLPKCYY